MKESRDEGTIFPGARASCPILAGWSGPVDTAGVKVVGDYVENYKHGLPSEVALLILFEPRVGVPKAIMDATDVTTHRTGAVTGIGARHLARKSSCSGVDSSRRRKTAAPAPS